MISSDVIRGYSDTIILNLLLQQDSYGYEISKEIQSRTNNKYSMKETTLYSAMTRMEKNGLIASYYGNETFGRRRTYYTITHEGIQYYQEKCSEWQLTKELIDKFTTKGSETDESNKKLCLGNVFTDAKNRGSCESEATNHGEYGGEV